MATGGGRIYRKVVRGGGNMTTGGGRMYRSKCAVEAIWPLEETRKLQGTWRCRKGLVTYRAIGRAVWTMTRTTGSSSSSLNREIDAASEMVHDAPECVAVGVYVRGESTPEPPNCSCSFRARLACASRRQNFTFGNKNLHHMVPRALKYIVGSCCSLLCKQIAHK